ncbi:fimbrial assembly protein [Bdellovibrio bacteriovorus]|uniref:Fimbrial assembly protein n=1 Tax=Bdellovibrio bacteriovorus TaxID=959 RepID=A0A150WSM2_BDEBC|nr:pilus assembly protein PilP [Bdellovibrio bacteriovorus]KYG67406.1 fimbrial assembly protein [Bdellovibrio bacteriovorus]
MKSFRWFFSYLVVASLGLGLAFVVSLKFMAPARSQDAPSSGELPAEFLKEVESTQVPTPPNTPPPTGAATPSANPGAVPSKVPPPPVDENAFGDGATTPDNGNMAAPTPAPPVPAQGQAPGATDVAAPTFQEMPYDPATRRDPFKAFRLARPVDPRTTQQLEPLQKFEVEKLQVIGILWDVRTPRAMIKDPDGAVHTVIKNSKVGRNDGFVAVIREGEVVVVETMYDDGKVTKETRVMELTK